MSDEYSIDGNFKTGKIDAATYRRKMERLRAAALVAWFGEHDALEWDLAEPDGGWGREDT